MVETGRGGSTRIVRKFLGVLGCVLILITGCGHASTSSKAADQSFLQQLHSEAPDINKYSSNAKLINLGNAICNDLRAGASKAQVADRLGETGAAAKLPPAYLSDVMAVANSALCSRIPSRTTPGNTGPGY